MEASGQLGRGGTRSPGVVKIPVSADPLAEGLQGRITAASCSQGDETIIQVSTGRYHTIALSEAGSVYTWGLNDWGQLGRSAVGAAGESDPTECFSGASCHDGEPKKVRQLQGESRQGRERGESSMQSRCMGGLKVVIFTLPGIRIIGVTSGRYNTVVLDDQGSLHVWGYDGCADGSLPEQSIAWKARRVKGELEGSKVVAVDVGECDL